MASLKRRDFFLAFFILLYASAFTLFSHRLSFAGIDHLIPAGSVWKYNDTGTDLGTTWRDVAYDDSGWASGPAELGYGDGDEATVISYGPDPNNRYPTYYFRKTFSVADPSVYTALTLEIIADDGAVAYLNGTEVYRYNMPGGAITYNTWASVGVGSPTESTWLQVSLNTANLVAGTNVLAVEIHQAAATSSDVSFNFHLFAFPRPNISFQDGVSPDAGYAGSRDTHIRSDTVDTNYGTTDPSLVDGDSPDASTIIKWDVSDITPSSTVTDAAIIFNVTNSTVDTYEIYEMKRNWVESEATWNLFSAGNSWQAAGAQGGNDIGSTILGTITTGSATLQRTIMLNASGLALLQSWVDNPANNNGIIFQDYSSAPDGIQWNSRENGTPARRPKLTIFYTPTTNTVVSKYSRGTPSVPSAYSSKGATNKCMGTFRIAGSGTVSALTHTEYGTSNAQQDLENVKLFLDDGDGNWEPAQDTTQLGVTTNFNGSDKATFSGFNVAAGSSTFVHLVLDIKSSIAEGATVGAEILNATDVTSTNTVYASSWPVPLGLSTIQDAIVVSKYAGGTPTVPLATINVETTAQCLGTFRFSGNGTVSAITLTEYGTSNALEDLSNVKLYLDDGDGNWESSQDTTQLGTTATFNASDKATFTGFTLPAAGSPYVHVVLDVKDSILKDETIGIEILLESDVTSSIPADAPWPLQLGTTTVSTIYPYLQDVTQNSIKGMWITDAASDSRVDYGSTSAYGSTITDANAVTVHEISISGLSSDTTYHYRVTSAGVSSADCTFKTAPPSDSGFQFISFSDNQGNTYAPSPNPNFEPLVKQMLVRNPKSIVFDLGDLNDDGSQNQWMPQLFLPARNIFKNNVLYPSPGNHDSTNGFALFSTYFENPDVGGSGTDRYYSFNYGNTHFIVLDTIQDLSAGSPQYNWISSDLDSAAATSATWIIAMGHYPAYSSGDHGETPVIVDNIVPLFESKGVDLYVCGHEHIYERDFVNGIYYLIDGTAGGTPRDLSSKPYTEYNVKGYAFCSFDVGTSKITVTGYNINGNIIDTFTLPKGADAITVSKYAGGTPTVPPATINVETAAQCLGTFKFSGDGTVTAITLTEYGTSNALEDLSNVKLFLDDGDGNWEPQQDITRLGYATTFDASDKATFTGFTLPAAGSPYVHVVLDVKDSILKDETIGIEILQADDVTSSIPMYAVSWPLQLGTTTVSTIYPYLQDVTQNSIKVMWITAAASDSRVDYGLTDAYGSTVTDANAVTVHDISLSGLALNTTYHYRVTSAGVSSTDCTFKTAPSSDSGFTFIAYGDNRASGSGPIYQTIFEAVNKAVAAHNPKTIVLNVGDIVNSGAQNEYQPQHFLPARNVLKNTPVYVSIGNHETGTTWYDTYFDAPTVGGSGSDRYYSFNYGNTHFIALDPTQAYASGSTQYNWLVNDLNSAAATAATWRIVFMHYPPYSSTTHSPPEVTTELVPVFESQNVDFVIAGHDHFYERHYKNGIYYLITGGGGAPLADEGSNTTYREYYKKTNEHCIIDVGTSQMKVTAYDNDNNVFDSFVIPKGTAVSAYNSGAPALPATSIEKNTTGNALGTFRIGSSGTVSAITLTEYGTCNAALDLANVKLFQDNGDGNWEPSQDTTQLGATTTFNGSNQATFSGFALNAGPNTYVHVVSDVTNSAASGRTIGIRIQQISDVTSDVTVSADSWPVALGPSNITASFSYCFVADTQNNRVVKRRSADFSYVAQVGSLGSGNDQFNGFRGIVSDGEFVYVADSGNNRIVKRRVSDLSYVSQIGSAGSGNDQFNSPQGIAADDTYLYIVDNGNGRLVKRLKSNLSFVAKIGAPGSGNDGFSDPKNICVDDAYIYVTDLGNSRIVKRLKSDLSYVSEAGSLNEAYGIEVDEAYVYVSQTSNRIVKSLKSGLSYVSEIASSGSGDGQFNSLRGLALDGTYLYVVDSGNNRIQKFMKSSLTFVRLIGGTGAGSGNDEFNAPREIDCYPWAAKTVSATGITIDTPESAKVVGQTPTVTGRAPPAATVIIKDQSGAALGTTIADDNGNFRIEIPAALATGNNVLTAFANGVAGDSKNVIIGSSPLPAEEPTITSPVNNAVIRGTTPTIQGHARAGSAVAIQALDVNHNLQTVGSGAVQPGGAYSVTCSSPLPAGTNYISVTCDGVTSSIVSVTFVDPFGVVFDSVFNTPIPGAQLTLYYDNDPGPGRSWIVAAPGFHIAPTDVNPQTTAADGSYSYLTINGDFYVSITTPNYTYPSAATTFPAGRTIVTGSRGEPFTVAGAVIEMDQPMDAGNPLPLKIVKDANKKKVSIGDIVTYAVTIENRAAVDINDVYVEDKIPPGFKYLSGKAILDNKRIADPRGQRPLVFTIGTVPARTTRVLKYQLVVGSGVTFGNYENTAFARYADGTVVSNSAKCTVKVLPDPLFDLGTIIGKVFWDKNANGFQDKGEPPVAGAQIVTEDGAVITADRYGRFHLPAVIPGRHLFRLDESSLPEGAYVTTEKMVIVDVTAGISAKVNFGVNFNPDAQKQGSPTSAQPRMKGVRVIQEKSRPEPRLNVSLFKDELVFIPDALKEPAELRIFTNYALFIKKWQVDILEKNTKSAIRTFEGDASTLNEPILWDAKDKLGGYIKKDRAYVYILTVTGKDGSLDSTRQRAFVIRQQGPALEPGTLNPEENKKAKQRWIEKESKINNLEKQSIKIDGETIRVIDATGSAGNIKILSSGKPQLTIPVNEPQESSAARLLANPQSQQENEGQEVADIILPSGEYDVEISGRQEVPALAPVVSSAASGEPETANPKTAPDNTPCVYSEHLKVGEDYLFFVAMGDSKMGYNFNRGQIEPVQQEDKFQRGFWYEGRLAYYLKGKIRGKYLITSSLDTERDKKELFRQIDPDRYYPVYGDGSTVNYDATNTQGPLYLLIEWDKSDILWGNYNTALADTEFSVFNRTLYGGKLHYETVSTTKFGDPQAKLIVFKARAKQKAAHNEFLGTGGSLFYLKNKDVIEGSDKVKIEVRDKISGLVLSTQEMSWGSDYTIDYSQGRIIFWRPVSQTSATSTIISNELTNGNPVYVVVDYEYETKDKYDQATYGIRAQKSVTDNLTIGSTYVKEEQLDKNYELIGFDSTLHLGSNVKLTGEYAESKAEETGNFISTDGGITFTELSTANADKGRAFGFKAEAHVLDKLGLAGYYKKIESGFSSTSTVSQQGKELIGLSLTYDFSLRTHMFLTHDIQRISDNANLQAQLQVGAQKTATTVAQVSHQATEKLKLTGEYRHQEVSEKKEEFQSQTNHEEDVLAAKADYKVNENVNLSLEQQVTLKGTPNHQTGAGIITKVFKWLWLRAKETVGTQGTATSFGATCQAKDKLEVSGDYTLNNYRTGNTGNVVSLGAKSKLDDKTEFNTIFALSDSADGSATQSVTFNSKRKVNDTLTLVSDRVYAKNNDTLTQGSTAGLIKEKEGRQLEAKLTKQYSRNESELSQSNIFGLSGDINDKLAAEGSFEKAEVQNHDGTRVNRYAGAMGLAYFDSDAQGVNLKASSKLELRFDRGDENARQYLLLNVIEKRINQETTLFAKANVSCTKNTTAESTLAQYKELITGLAYRPINFDRLNFIGKYTYLENDDPGSQSDFSDIEKERAHVLAAEVLYEISRQWQVVEKLAYKEGEEKVSGFDFTRTQTWLMVHRLNYKFKKDWLVGAEYRRLAQRQAKDCKQGFLIEASRKIGEFIQLGVGYNFTDFNDDLTHLDYTAQGPFIRITGSLYEQPFVISRANKDNR